MILTSRESNITTILLNRPEKRNAMTPPMLRELVDAIAGADGSSAVVLGGTGDSFCAGFDLSLCKDDDRVLGDLLTGLYDAVAALRRVPCPVIIAAHGAAIAGGCALLGGADFVITNAAAKLGYPVVRLGISPAVTAPFLRHSVGDSGARSMLLEGKLIDGAEAARIGLACECVGQPTEVMPKAMELAKAFAAKPAHGVRTTRAWLNELDRTSASNDAATRAGLKASLALVGHAEARERLAALWAPKPK